MKMQSWVGLAILAAVISGGVGCSGKTSLGDDGTAGSGGTETPGAGGSAGSAYAAGTSPGGSAAGGPRSELDLSPPTDTCPAACGEPAGDVLPSFESIDQVYRSLMGRWRICSGASTFIGPDDIVGVEYEAPTLRSTNYGGIWQGNMYYLVEGTDGPERGKGFGYQLTYDVLPQDGGSPNQLNMTASGTFVALFRYSPCPRQWLLNGMVHPEGAVLVPID